MLRSGGYFSCFCCNEVPIYTIPSMPTTIIITYSEKLIIIAAVDFCFQHSFSELGDRNVWAQSPYVTSEGPEQTYQATVSLPKRESFVASPKHTS